MRRLRPRTVATTLAALVVAVGCAGAVVDAPPLDGGPQDARVAVEDDARVDATNADTDADARAPDAAVLDCPPTTTVTLSSTQLALQWWPNEQPPLAAVALRVSDPQCHTLYVTVSAAWLRARAEPDAGALTVRIDGAQLLSGDHSAQVELRAVAGGPVLGTLDVRLRAWVRPGPNAARRVLVVGLDGVRADALAFAHTPVIDRLARHGFSTFDARTQQSAPTLSGPGWSSILTGVEASRHRIFANSGWSAFDRSYLSFMKRARDEGLRTAAACHWAPILDEILEDDALDTSARGGDDEVADAMVSTLVMGLHDVHFVHFDDTDAAGHAQGFATYAAPYIAAIEAEDARLGRLIDALFARPALMAEDWLVLVVTDHGGEGRDHGALSEACRRIPLIVGGTAARTDERISVAHHMDVAATVARFLGLAELPYTLDGAPLGIGVEGRCADGVDDDGDGDLDCGDSDCALDARCSQVAPQCPGADLGDALGFAIARSDTSSAAPWRTGSCGGAGREHTFAWRAPADDLYAFDTVGSDYDTVLYVRRGCDGVELACNQDFYPGPRQDVPINTQSGLRVRAQAGESLVLVVDAANASAAGTLVLNAHAVEASCPEQDLGSAVGPDLARGNNAAAPTRHVASCAGMARDTVMSWTAPSDGDYAFSTEGASFDTVLLLLAGRCGAVELACNDDRGGGNLQSRVVRTVAAGETVSVVVGGFRGRSGDWVLGVERL